MKIVKKCIYCGGELKPTDGLFDEEQLKELEKMGIPKSDNYNCIECGQIYDKYFKVIEYKLGWLKK